MIKLKKIQTRLGMTKFTFEYDVPPDPAVYEVVVDEREIMKRLNTLHSLVGRDLTLQGDVKQVVVQLINEVRLGDTPWLPDYNYESFVGVDLEG